MTLQETEFIANRWRYSQHVAAIARPGRAPEVPNVHQMDAGDVTSWEHVELNLLIDEGRRQADGQQQQLSEIRTRAQFVFATGLALAGLLLADSGPFIVRSPRLGDVLTGGGFLAALWGVLGAASVIVSTAALSTIDAALLSRAARSEVLMTVATAYSKGVGTGANTVAGRLTVLREAVVWVLLAAIFAAAAYLRA